MDIELLINVPTMSNGGSLGNEKHLLNATQPMPARQNAQNLCLSLSQRVDLSHGRDRSSKGVPPSADSASLPPAAVTALL